MNNKKLLIVLFLFLILGTGCKKESKEMKVYNEYKTALFEERKEMYDEVYNNKFYQVEFVLDRVSDQELVYRVIVDRAKSDMENVSILAVVVDSYTESSNLFPSVGIFEKPVMIESKSGKNKGVILNGYIPYKEDVSTYNGEIRVLIHYIQNGIEHYDYLNKVFNK